MVFKFSKLPKELKNSVFSYVNFLEAVKFLKTDKDSRTFILFNGPFPKKLEELKITVEQIEFGNSHDFIFHIPGFIIKIESNGREELTFIFTESLLTIQGYEHPFYAEKPLLLFNLIKSCRSIDLQLMDDSENDVILSEKFLTNLFETEFLPKLSQIVNLRIFSLINIDASKIFLQNFHQKVAKICIFEALELGQSNEIEEYFWNFLEKSEILNCPVLVIASWNLQILMKASPEIVIIHDDDIDYFVDFIDEYLEDGVKCKNSDVATAIFSNETIPRDFNMEMFYNFVMEKIVNRSSDNWMIDFLNGDSEELGPFLQFFMKKYGTFGGNFIQGPPYIDPNSKNFSNLETFDRDYKYRTFFKREVAEKTFYYMITLEEIDERKCTMQLLMKRF